MNQPFSSDFFTGNRDRLRALSGQQYPMVITANGQLQKSQDTAYEFTQDGHFWYLTGLDNPDIILVMDRHEEFLIVPELSVSKIFFDGDIIADDLKRISGISTVLTAADGMRLLQRRLKAVKQVGLLEPAPEYVDQLGMYTNPARSRLVRTVKDMNQNIKIMDIREHIARLRMVKQPAEVKALQTAIDITCRGVAQAMERYLAGDFKTERDGELFLRGMFYEQGGAGHAFEPIVASGDKACTIHPLTDSTPINDKPLLVDVGAAYGAYKADISRTWTRKPDKRFTAVLHAVKEVSDYAMSQLKPGVIMREYEKSVERQMGKKLKQLGLIKTASSSNVRAYFPHATSHFLGIDVHDVGLYDEPLTEGVVLTVEPGIYIKDEGIGVRIENDVLITKDGCTNLSASLADLQPNM